MSESNRHIALVTGGSRGIGKAIALAFANSGVGVAIDYRERAEEAASVVDVIHRIGGPAVAIAVNLKSVFLCTQAVLPHMRARRWGRNINISSIGARIGARSSSVAWVVVGHVWFHAIQARKLLPHIRRLKTALETRTR